MDLVFMNFHIMILKNMQKIIILKIFYFWKLKNLNGECKNLMKELMMLEMLDIKRKNLQKLNQNLKRLLNYMKIFISDVDQLKEK